MATLASLPTMDPDADWSLPGWIYTDPEFLELETARILRPSWQILCHESDLAEAGDWRTICYLGENIVAVRGRDGAIRAFHNVCRHRAMRIVEGDAGCAKKLVCPYHAWTYELDGRLSGVPMRRDYPALDMDAVGLVPVDVSTWRGFVFVRLEDDGGPSVAEMMAPYDAEIAPYRFEEMRRIGDVRTRDRAVNWKNVGDNYSDNLHIPVAHDGLTRLFGKSLCDRGVGLGRQDVGRSGRSTLGQSVGSILPAPSAPRRPFARGEPAALALLQALAEHGVRHLRRPNRLHAMAADVFNHLRAARNGVRAAR